MRVPHILFLLVILLSLSHARVALPTVAVLDFDAEGLSVQESRVLTNRLRTHLVQLGGFRVVERGQMETIFEELNFQESGCTSDECAVQVGEMLGVEMMLAGTFGKLGSTYTVDLRLIDVATASILKSALYDHRGTIDGLLSRGLEKVAREITKFSSASRVLAAAPITEEPGGDVFTGSGTKLNIKELDSQVSAPDEYDVVIFKIEEEVASFINSSTPGGSEAESNKIAANFWNDNGEFVAVVRHAKEGFIVLKHSGNERTGTFIAMTEQGYPIVPSSAIRNTIEPYPLTEEELAGWAGHVASEIATRGSSRTLIRLSNGNIGEVHYRLNTDNPVILEYIVQLTNDDTLDESDYGTVIVGVNHWKVTTYGELASKWLF